MSALELGDAVILFWLKAMLLLGCGLLIANSSRMSAARRHFILLLCLWGLPLLGAVVIGARFIDIATDNSQELLGGLFIDSLASLAAVQLPALTPWQIQPDNLLGGKSTDQGLLVHNPGLLLVIGYLCVAATLLSRWAVVQLRSARFVHNTRILNDTTSQQLWQRIAGDNSTPLRVSLTTQTPAVWGIKRAIAVVPPDWTNWTGQRQQAALRHEHAHIQRNDVLTTTLAGVIACLFWVVPLVWLTQQQLRLLAEIACDDAVLRAGTDADDYAKQLISIARRSPQPDVAEIAMANPSSLKQRITALINQQQRRNDMNSKQKFQIIVLAGVLLAPLAATGVAPDDTKSTTISAADPTAEFDSKLNRVTTLVAAEQYEQARDLAASLLQTTSAGSQRAKLQNQIGYANYQLDDYPAAIRHFTEVIAEAPSSLTALRTKTHYSLAQLHFVTANYQQALIHIQDWQVIAKDTGPIPYIFMGQVYYQLNDYPRAVTALEKGLDRVESEKDIRENWWALLLYLEYEMEHWERCVKVLAKLQEFYPSEAYDARMAKLERVMAEA